MNKNKYGLTITTFLIHGSASGPRYVSLEGLDIKCLVIPRESLSHNSICSRPDIQQTSVYLLLDKTDDIKPEIYVGEAENLIERLKQHSVKKSWDMAIAFISYGNNLTKSDVMYLERKIYKAFSKTNINFTLTNSQEPGAKNMTEHRKTTMKQFFDDIKILVEFLGYDYFKQSEGEKLGKMQNLGTNSNIQEDEIFYCVVKKRGINAKMIVHSGQYILLEDSIILKGARERNPSLSESRYLARNNNREEILKNRSEDIEGHNGTLCKTTTNITFKTPSAAATFVVGRAMNGWTEWKNSKGQTIDERHRQ